MPCKNFPSLLRKQHQKLSGSISLTQYEPSNHKIHCGKMYSNKEVDFLGGFREASVQLLRYTETAITNIF